MGPLEAAVQVNFAIVTFACAMHMMLAAKSCMGAAAIAVHLAADVPPPQHSVSGFQVSTGYQWRAYEGL